MSGGAPEEARVDSVDPRVASEAHAGMTSRGPRARVRAAMQRVVPRRRPRGQSLAEFAISVPVVLLMVLFGIDFGRVFVGWVTLNQAVREAANFAAYNPDGWSPRNTGVVTEYERLINFETAGMNCVLPNPIPDPTFPSGNGVGDPALVAITCKFTVFTPIISNIVGPQVNVSASASFPIRSGAIQGIPLGSAAPLPTGTGAPPSVDPSQSVGPSVAATPTPVPQCRVPLLIGIDSNQAVPQWWRPAGFNANNLLFTPIVPPKYTIQSQTIAAGTMVPCTSTMTVTPNP